MARIKYYYDTEKCKYERITPNMWTVLLNLFGFFFVAFIMAVGLVFLYDHYFETPSEIILKTENEGYLLEIQITDKLVRDLETDIKILKERDKEVYRMITGVDSIPFVDQDKMYNSVDRYNDIFEGKKDALKQTISAKILFMTF